jgi:hypothetical protein
MTINLSMKILETNADIDKKIRKAMAQDLNKRMKKALRRIEPRFRNMVMKEIQGTPEISSLVGGRLQFEFGLTQASQKVSKILQEWSKSLTITSVRFTPSARSIKGSVKIQMIQANYDDVLGLNAARQQTEKGQSLAWLKWLLLDGDKIIVREYEIGMGDGRAGPLVMRKNRSGRWRVPPEFSGTARNNFVTRAVDNVLPELEKMIIAEIQQ